MTDGDPPSGPDRTPPAVLVRAADQLPHAVELLVSEGWRAQPGFGLPDEYEVWDLSPRRLLRYGVVADAHDVQRVMLAVARGVAVVIIPPEDEQLRLQLLEDLARAAQISEPTGDVSPTPLTNLTAEQKRILALLAEGESIPQIASTTSTSQRTVARRVADIRARLGVQTTVEAVMIFRRFREPRNGEC